MQLIIAEKKDVAQAIAEAITSQSISPKNGVFDTPDYQITWLFGHMLELISPEDHDPALKSWSLAQLPMDLPVAYNPIPRTTKQLNIVMALCKKADTIINAGDPDPEGQRLVDEVLEYAEVTNKPAKRLLINDNNAAAIINAMQDMPDNSQYHGLSMSALARSLADRHFGINLTRLYTVTAEKAGYEGVLSVGRVQTPMLGLIVNRDHAHESHEKTPFYTVTADIALPNQNVTATYQPTKEDQTDDSNRLAEKADAEAIKDQLQGAEVILKNKDTKPGKRLPPLPFNLLALQSTAAGQYGYSPKLVLEITQSLRDKNKAITYNRSDCRYLNDERHLEAPELINALAPQFGLLANEAQPQLKSKAFNTSKVTAHHAIIPTANIPNLDTLPEQERNIYQLIVLYYLAQFYPPEEFRTTTLIFEVEDKTLKANGRVDVSPGWTALFKEDPDQEKTEDHRQNLETATQDATAAINSSACTENFTKPKPYYTMQTLLQDLPRVSKYVKDPKIKKLLLDKDADKQDEAGGIGTPATRDSMIDKLFQREYITEQSKNIVSTDLGRQFIAALPDFATTPDMTALWHEKQHQIEKGELNYQALIDEVKQAVSEEVTRVKSDGLPLKIKASKYTCPKCKTGNLKKRKGQWGDFWSCSDREKCRATFSATKGKPNLTPKNKPEPSTEHNCPQCQKPLIRRESTKKKGQHWWGCTGFKDGCKFTAQDKNNQPVISNA